MRYIKNSIKQNKKISFTFILLVICGCCYIINKYYNFRKYVSTYNCESSDLAERIESYSIARMDNVPNNEKDFNVMLEWLKKNENIEGILEYGINFKYNNFDQSLSIYSFGIDKIDDDLEKPSYSIPTNEYSIFNANDSIKDWNFFDTLKTRGKDVLLFKVSIDEDYLCRNFVKSNLFSNEKLLIPYAQSYIFYQGNEKVSGELKNQLQKKIAHYKNLINPNIPKLNDSTRLSFIRFKNREFISVCSDDIDVDIFDEELKEFLILHEIDYAIIPILQN